VGEALLEAVGGDLGWLPAGDFDFDLGVGVCDLGVDDFPLEVDGCGFGVGVFGFGVGDFDLEDEEVDLGGEGVFDFALDGFGKAPSSESSAMVGSGV
jgi:hypothetical protein